MAIGRVPGATGIQPSIVTAKGDLIVATANGSVTNQAVGTNNQVLMADSAQGDGVRWANEATATLTTTGDILYASAANTLARRAIGSTGDVLTVSGGLPTWAAPAAGGITLISTTTVSGSSVSLTSIPSTYTNLLLVMTSVQTSANDSGIYCQVNSDTGNNYAYNILAIGNTATESAGNSSGGSNIYIGTTTATSTAGYRTSATIQFFDYTSTSPRVIESQARTRSTTYYATWGNAMYLGSSAISSIQIVLTAGTYSAGTIKLYGVK